MSTESKEYFNQLENDSDFEDNDNHNKFLKSIGVELEEEVLQKNNEQRTEPSTDVSLFSISQKDVSNEGKKIQLHQLLKDIKDSGNANVLRKQINRLQRPKQHLSTPLSKPVSERLQRKVEYEKSSMHVGKWDPIVQKHRKSDNIKFPLNQQPLQIKTVDQFLARKSKSMTPLEEQISALLTGNKCLERPDHELSVVEEKAIAAMSLNEARERLFELRKHRALLSYHQAKNRRQHKIKSRKYHRMLHKRKMKALAGKDIKEDEVIVADRMRAEERASLRHRTGSKWAKNRLIMAKHNEKMKLELEEQRKKHKELVEKPVQHEEDMLEDDECMMEEDGNQLQLPVEYSAGLISENPWLRNKSTEVGQIPTSNNNLSTVVQHQLGKKFTSASNVRDNPEDAELKLKDWLNGRTVSHEAQYKCAIPVAETDVTRKFKEAVIHLKKFDNVSKQKNSDMNSDNEIDSNEEHNTIDGLNETNKELDGDSQLNETANEKLLLNNDTKTNKIYSQVKTKVDSPFTIPSSKTSIEAAEIVASDASCADMEQRMTIEQAFADDDVLSEFKLDKEQNIEESKPQDEDLSLPGWGTWGGAGIKSHKKKKRKVKNIQLFSPRKDHSLGHVILNDTRDVHIAKHQVNHIPFPFVNKDQFESSVARPIGTTWNTQETFSTLAKNKIETVKGAIIAPMDADEIGETNLTLKTKQKKSKVKRKNRC